MSETLRVLIVDDDEVDRMMVRRGLRSAGVEADFTEANEVSTALAALQQATFDCIFLDFQLPGGDGLRVLREAREAGITTPVVVLTGRDDGETAAKLLMAGATDYLNKASAVPERLERALRHAIRVHRAEEERERAVTARNRFYAAMSHEIRTPMNAILGYTDLLLAGAYGALTEPQTLGIERTHRAAQHLLELVNDVLDFSKLEAGKLDLEWEPTIIPMLIEDLLATVQPLAQQSDTELKLSHMDCTEPILTDPRRVRQVLLNLVSNAIKFGESKPVEVRCSCAAADELAVEVIDQGAGIASENLTRIFEEFVQLGRDDQRGTGLGLPISKRLMEMLGGRLEVESEIGVGSTFRLVLPKTRITTPNT